MERQKYKCIRILGLTLALLVGSCTTLKKESPPTEPIANLSLEESLERKEMLGKLRYDLTFDLTAGEEGFSGSTQIEAEILKLKSDLRLDFFKGEVTRILINDQESPILHDQVSITLPKKMLKLGLNKIQVDFKQKFARDGAGLTVFKDPIDQNLFIHSQFQPYSANRVFPNFDQPDLKATFSAQIKVPASWQVVTATRETKIEKLDPKTSLWHFPESAVFSTYLWSLHAGPYKVWEDNTYKYPLRLFARPSLAKHVVLKDWFGFTKQGFDYFDKYFDFAYPYKKYDQLIVPGFSAGAMENVAAVTFSERFISRGQVTRAQRYSLASVIMHEMAHMWFGNLVTMRWWDELWLNESFATYMAAHSLAEFSEFKDSWRMFFGSKSWAYWEDQLVTTHPIMTEVLDTRRSLVNFDGITYGKGAAVLKQLSYYVGEENFKLAVQKYFKKHAEGNTVLSDFTGALAEQSGKDLKSWEKLWLKTANLNTLQAEISCHQGKIDRLEILQSAPKEYPYLRPHSFEVALLNPEKNQMKVVDRFKAEVALAKTALPQAVGKVCPSIVYLNSNDHAYFKVNFDPISAQNLSSSIHKISDPFLRQMLWASLWDMTQEAKLDFFEYGKVALNLGLKLENDETILRALIRSLSSGHSVMGYFYKGELTSSEKFKEFVALYDKVVWERLKSAKPKSDLQQSFFNALIAGASSAQSLKRLEDFLMGRTQVPGLKIDQDQRWEMIATLSSHQWPKVEDLIAKESKKDKSANGEEGRIASLASLPNWENKQIWITEFKSKDSKYPISHLRAAARSLFPRHQSALRQSYAKEFFEDLKVVNQNAQGSKIRLFSGLAPFPCANSEDPFSPFLKENQKQLDPMALKSLLINRQELERCRAVVTK